MVTFSGTADGTTLTALNDGISLPLPPPSLIVRNGGAGVELVVSGGSLGDKVVIERSLDLQTWTPYTILFRTAPGEPDLAPALGRDPQEFYRISPQ